MHYSLGYHIDPHSSTLQLEPQCHPQLLQYQIATVVSFRYAALSCTEMVAREVYAVIRSLRSECILTYPLFFTLLGMTGTTPGMMRCGSGAIWLPCATMITSQ